MNKSNDPTVLLKHDHDAVKKLFKEIDKSRADQQELFDQIHTELQIHTRIEEELFYPAVAKMESASAKNEVREAKHEHSEVKKILQKMSKMTPDDNQFEASLRQLEQDVEHHVKEEEGKIFPDVRKHMEESELMTLGKQLSARKEELEESEKGGHSAAHATPHASK